MIAKIKSQQTLEKPIKLEGVGLHTGEQIRLILNPALENTGIQFVRTDLDPQVEIPALANFVTLTDRGTTIEKEGVKIQTIEHLLAALFAAGISNCRIEINGSEIPIMDGSSKPFSDVIEKGGVKSQEEEQEIFVVQEVIEYNDAETGSEILILPSDDTSFNVMIDFQTKVLGTQNACLLYTSPSPRDGLLSRMPSSA